jgi:hypothetical protein
VALSKLDKRAMMQLLETSSLYEDNDYIMRKIKEIFRVESVPELIPVLEKNLY